MPCLDEAETLQICIEKALNSIRELGVSGEVVIADNGSTDGSQEIATRCGARVVDVAERGYGSALMGGIEAARGDYVIMGDADDSYDFSALDLYVAKLREGYQLVMGNRFAGDIKPGAMPFLHRYLGNPILSWLGRLLFHCPISDFHCGLRGFERDAMMRLGLATTGMEFASEMVVKASARGLRVEEVPIVLYPDGRSRPPHLRTWRDGWRHLRFMLTLSPRYTLLFPGLLLMLVFGALLVRLWFGTLRLGPMTLDIHSMQIAGLLVTVGYQAVTTAIAARIYAVEEEIGPPVLWMQRAFSIFTLERGLLGGALLALAGGLFISAEFLGWARGGFGSLEPTVSMRPVVLGATLFALGIQTLLMSFLYSMLGIRRRGSDSST